jgi:hypothetical protein
VLGVRCYPAAARSEAEESATAQLLDVLADGFAGMIGISEAICQSRCRRVFTSTRQLQPAALHGAEHQPYRSENQPIADERAQGRARRAACALLKHPMGEQLKDDEDERNRAKFQLQAIALGRVAVLMGGPQPLDVGDLDIRVTSYRLMV